MPIWKIRLVRWCRKAGYETLTAVGLALETVGVGLAILWTSGWETPVFVALLGMFVLLLGVAGENKG